MPFAKGVVKLIYVCDIFFESSASNIQETVAVRLDCVYSCINRADPSLARGCSDSVDNSILQYLDWPCVVIEVVHDELLNLSQPFVR